MPALLRVRRRTLKTPTRRRVVARKTTQTLRAGSKRKRAGQFVATKKMKQKQPKKVKIKPIERISQDETQQFDDLITSSFQNSSIRYLDKNNECVFVSIGKTIVAVMFLKPVCVGPNGLTEEDERREQDNPTASSPGYGDSGAGTFDDANFSVANVNKYGKLTEPASSNNSNCMYVHTVCVSSAHRGEGLLHKMLYFVSTLPQFKHTIFKLEASNTVEHANGLNQAARFQIYSKSGFTLPVGTVVEPGGHTVLGVATQGHSRWTREHRSIFYTLRSPDGKEQTVSYQDVRPETCYMNSIKQEKGCLMESDSVKLRDFNYPKVTN